MMPILTRSYLSPLLLAILLLAAHPADAQDRRGEIGLGGQIGDPSGLTLRLYGQSRYVLDFLVAWDLDDDFFFLNVHGLLERRLRNSPLNFFYGPGVVLGFEERGKEDKLVLGLSGDFGINYFVERFEVFLQLTPRLTLLPGTDGDFGGGGGLRYYF